MHPYATDSPGSPKLFWAIALLGLGFSSVVGCLTSALGGSGGWQVGSVSGMTCFAIIYYIFDYVLWKGRLVRRALLVPDLNGVWECSGRTVTRGPESLNIHWKGELLVRQCWSRISVVLSTAQSRSCSIAASVYRDAGGGYRLIYHYDNDPSQAEQELARHTGLCRIVFPADLETGSGDYFTDKDRMTVGTINLVRKELSRESA